MTASSLRSPEFQPSERNPGVDALRGVSILLVILNHIGIRIPLAQTFLAAAMPAWLLDVLTARGYEAVFIFFVISGFLITTMSLQRWGSLNRVAFRGFYGRRFARIAPLLLALVFLLSVLHVLGIPDYVIHRPGQSLPGAIRAALALHLNWYEGRTSWLPGGWDVLWSLSIEETFYLAFPVVAILTRRTWVLLALLAVLALSLPVSRGALAENPVWQEKAYLPGMAAIAMGMIGALAASRFTPRSQAVCRLLCGLGIAGVAGTLVLERFLWPVIGNGMFLLLTFSTMCVLVGLQRDGAAGARKPMWGLGWLRSMGRNSYEIYLTHMFVVFAGAALFRYMGGGLLWYAAIVLLCWALGAIVARCFSVPCDRALRRFLLRHEQLPLTAPVPEGTPVMAAPGQPGTSGD